MAAVIINPSSVLARNVASYAGQAGQRWLDELPQRVAELAARWKLTHVQPYTNLSFNFVALATQAEQRVVLKIGLEDLAIRRESNWLSHYGQHTNDLVVPVLARDGDNAYLMQRLTPGASVDQLSDEDSTEIIGQCIHALTEVSTSIPREADYPTIREWFAALMRASEASRRVLGKRIDRAFSLSEELQQRSEKRLLHGDLHHTNILKDANLWIVTDPHGVIGDPTHECAAMLRNALGSMNGAITKCVHRRVDQLASVTGFDPGRIAAWGYAQNVLSSVWALDADPTSDVADVIAVIDALEQR